MMDFVVREGTAVVRGELAMVRLGTCGGLGHTRPGNVVVATKGLVLVRQEPDFVHASEGSDDEAAAAAPAAAGLPMSPTRQVPYSISRIVMPDAELSEAFATAIDAQLQASKGSTSDISAYSVTRGSGATADSFYASQGRINAIFDDRNETLVGEIEKRVPDAAALEMESFHLISLAKASRGKLRAAAATIPVSPAAPGRPTTAPSDQLSARSPDHAACRPTSPPSAPARRAHFHPAAPLPRLPSVAACQPRLGQVARRRSRQASRDRRRQSRICCPQQHDARGRARPSGAGARVRRRRVRFGQPLSPSLFQPPHDAPDIACTSQQPAAE